MRAFLFFGLFLWINSCQRVDTSHQYIFLGHPYDWNAPDKVDPRLAKLDYDLFDQIWLGGDICSHLTQKKSTLDYVDDIFDLSSPNTLWTLGNHDVLEGNTQWISDHTHRPFFYTIWQDGICIMVLNTNLFWYYDSPPPQENCREKDRQMEMMQSVLDTIQDASHLVILHHLALLGDIRKNEKGTIPDSFNINPAIIHPSCDSNLLLKNWWYPQLVKVQNRGVDVIFVGGDFGMRARKFEFHSKEGVVFLGSGINGSLKREFAPEYVTSFGRDFVLIFEHHPNIHKLDWQFCDLDSLLKVQPSSD